jgi:hypothetical protein
MVFYIIKNKNNGCLLAYILSAIMQYRRNFTTVLLIKQLLHNRSILIGPLVLNLAPFIFFLLEDRDRTVSRRSEPSSCTTLFGEQPDPWNLVHLQDVISRHRGAKLFRR